MDGVVTLLELALTCSDLDFLKSRRLYCSYAAADSRKAAPEVLDDDVDPRTAAPEILDVDPRTALPEELDDIDPRTAVLEAPNDFGARAAVPEVLDDDGALNAICLTTLECGNMYLLS